MMTSSSRHVALLGGILALWSSAWGKEVTLKELVNIRGVRSNRLIGYGLVFGLPGKGDSAASPPTKRAAAQMLSKLGLPSKPEDIAIGNIAAVMVSADLPPFAQNGDILDVRVASQGDAKSLAGGTLLQTPLKAGDGHTYAMAQGPLVVAHSSPTSNASVSTVGTIPRGGMVEREYSSGFIQDGGIQLSLKHSDFTTNDRVMKRINQAFRGFYATSINPTHIRVQIPPAFAGETTEFISLLESLTVEIEPKAVIVINERTGTVVLGQDLLIEPVTIAHGQLSIKITPPARLASPAATSSVPSTPPTPFLGDPEKTLLHLDAPTVGGVVEMLNQLGVKPADLVGILQAMHSAGAIHAEIKLL